MTTAAPGLALAALVGLALGSYAVTAGLRFTRAESSAGGRSHCDRCGQTLSFAQTLPVLSYIWARGACAKCRAPIDPVHLVGELSGLVIVLTALMVHDLVRTPLLGVLGLTLTADAVIDWKIGRLPDVLAAAIAIMALTLSGMTSLAALEIGVLAAAATFVGLQILRWTAAKLRRDPGLGLGDVKLICALALWLGARTPWMIVVAAGLGLLLVAIARPSGGRVAFGPALAAAAWAIGMVGEWGYWPTTA